MENEEKNIKNFDLNETAMQLFQALEKENSQVKDFLMRNYKGLPVSAEMAETTYNYFVNHSVIAAATISNPGTSVITELLYEGTSSSCPLDQYFLQSKAGKAIKARLIAIKEELPKIIEEYRKQGDVLIGNLGSGPGRDVIDVLFNYYRDISNVRAINIDRDKVALERGKRIAKSKGIDHLVDFIPGNFLNYKPSTKFDILLFVGILCPLNIETCIEYLKTIKTLLKENGCLIASNVSKKMLKDDPFTCYIMEWGANWKLVYKDEQELKQIFDKAGYVLKRYFLDSYGFNIMGIGTPVLY